MSSRAYTWFAAAAAAMVVACGSPDDPTGPGSGSRTKVLVAADVDVAAIDDVVDVIDYGAFRLLIVDAPAATVASLGVVRDDMNRLWIDGLDLDTRRPDLIDRALPPHLQRLELRAAVAERRAPRDGIYLVQMVGPIRDEWLDELVATGIEPIIYLPENAYIVRATGAAAAALPQVAMMPHVQYVGDYHPGYRLAAPLRAELAGRITPPRSRIEVVVQIPDGPSARDQIADLKQMAISWIGEDRVLRLHNAELVIDGSRLVELVGKPYVLHVEERLPRERLDEVQGQIVAGQLTGNGPSGPGYHAWLADHGFSSSQFDTFAINVVDDAYTVSGHPDLPGSRVAFEHNPTNQAGLLGGHGFLNAHIVGGDNESTGAAFEDAEGFNYGLGIAPFARVGATAIFGAAPATPQAWESTAYASGARISTNSWGFTGTSARRYDVYAQAFDAIVRDASPSEPDLQPLIVVFAAGNSGSAANTVSSPGTAKNVLTVGAGENDRPTGTDGCLVGATGADSVNDVISFSSRGPVNSAGGDGRVKPDIMAPGTHIQGGIPQASYNGSSVCNQYWPAGQTLYAWSSGTSHSCPAVAGGAALVYQHFLNLGLPAPSPAMTKAYLMGTATHMTGVSANDTLPSNNQGMGRMNLGRGFDGTERLLVDQTVTFGGTGETYTTTGTIADGAQPFRVTLAWSDAPGPTSGAPWVNNLDLEVVVGGVTYLGNRFSGPSSITGGVADIKNNVESVFLPAGVSGPFTITVRATNVAGDGVPGNPDPTDQDFALVVYNGTCSPPSCDDGNPCTSDSCEPGGCANTPVADGTACADADVCNGAETCQAGACAAGTELDCDDDNTCTADACDPVAGCVHTPLPCSAACSYDAVSGTITVTMSGLADTLSIASGNIMLGATMCGTLTGTDAIVVNGTGPLTIVGDFVPGRTAEPSGTSEIEFTINNDVIVFDLGAGADVATISTTGADLYADGDQDIVMSGAQTKITYKGGFGNDTLDASAATGPIYLYGNTGVDHLIGGAGADFLYGGADADTLEGGAGVDHLYGGPGNDVERGGDGNDTFHEDATSNGSDILDGGPGNDKLDYARRSAAVTVTLGDAIANDGEPGEADAPTAIERATGGAGDDTIIGTSTANTLKGGAGNDTLRGGGGSDTLYGDADDDYLDGEAGADKLYGGAGNDTLVGDAAATDTFVCEDGDDTVVGNTDGRAETVNCGAGTDTAHGNGEDTFTACETLTP